MNDKHVLLAMDSAADRLPDSAAAPLCEARETVAQLLEASRDAFIILGHLTERSHPGSWKVWCALNAAISRATGEGEGNG